MAQELLDCTVGKHFIIFRLKLTSPTFS